ncbi:hypothetical protein [Methanomethylophilus alvi]|uniref:hypothetical protein n=1 Tax=Methanomethylophilus alvi TaxID=1291540 RepID=UPI0037DCDA72
MEQLIIFDGNHYLYLYDKDYASQAPEYAESHDRIGNVDPKIMERIAEELPLSSQRRPQWDVDTLIELGVRTIKVDTDEGGIPLKSSRTVRPCICRSPSSFVRPNKRYVV